jgi:hypothetical protein
VCRGGKKGGVSGFCEGLARPDRGVVELGLFLNKDQSRLWSSLLT